MSRCVHVLYVDTNPFVTNTSTSCLAICTTFVTEMIYPSVTCADIKMKSSIDKTEYLILSSVYKLLGFIFFVLFYSSRIMAANMGLEIQYG